jgi:hypothetical protein
MRLDAGVELLRQLLVDGSLPGSRLGSRLRHLLRPLFAAGVLEEAAAGSGARIVVRHTDALRQFAINHYPAWFDASIDISGLPPRAAAIAMYRDAKAVVHSDREPIWLRSDAGAVLTRDTATLDVGALTSVAGCASLMLDGRWWTFRGCVALVENREVFGHSDRHPVHSDLVVLYDGRISDRLLTWLASPAMADATYIHCPDYDPVGLDEYLRLVDACASRATLFLPEDLKDLTVRFGKAELLEEPYSQQLLIRLRQSADRAVRHVVSIMDACNRGLEQEILVMRRDGGSLATREETPRLNQQNS